MRRNCISLVGKSEILLIEELTVGSDSNNQVFFLLTTAFDITDENPITARQCVKALAEVGQAKPHLIPEILSALRSADLSQYKDSMRPLIDKDILETVEKLAGFQSER